MTHTGTLQVDYILKEVSKIFIDTLRKTDFLYTDTAEKKSVY